MENIVQGVVKGVHGVVNGIHGVVRGVFQGIQEVVQGEDDEDIFYQDDLEDYDYFRDQKDDELNDWDLVKMANSSHHIIKII